MFVIDDEQPTLVETAHRKLYDETWAAVRRVIDPARLRYIVVPHFEADECGGLNHFLDSAPHAVPVCSPVGAATSISDFAIRDPLRVDEETVLDLGHHQLRFLVTPYVHAWDSVLAFDATTRTLFSSDLFMQPGGGPAMTDRDISEEMVNYTRSLGLFPSRAHLEAALDKIAPLQPATLACHHGTVRPGPSRLISKRSASTTSLASLPQIPYTRRYRPLRPPDRTAARHGKPAGLAERSGAGGRFVRHADRSAAAGPGRRGCGLSRRMPVPYRSTHSGTAAATDEIRSAWHRPGHRSWTGTRSHLLVPRRDCCRDRCP